MIFQKKAHYLKPLSYLALTLVILIPAGCATVGPDYVPPKTTVSEDWQTDLKGGLTAEEIESENPGRLVDDAQRSAIIQSDPARGPGQPRRERGLGASSRGARPSGHSQGRISFPSSTPTGSATWSRSSKDSGGGKSNELYAAGFDAGWELDIFGGVRRSVEAAEADLQASQEDLRDVLVSLLAEVALNYMEVRTFKPGLPWRKRTWKPKSRRTS